MAVLLCVALPEPEREALGDTDGLVVLLKDALELQLLLEEKEPMPDSDGVLRLLRLALDVPERLTVAQELAEAEPLSEVVVDGEGAPGPVTVADVELLPEGQLLTDTVLELLTDTLTDELWLPEAVPQEV